MAKVYVKFNSAVIRELDLTKEETTFGRKPTNDIVLDHATVSGFHGKIRKTAAGWMIEDLNSTNGTFINGHRIKSQELKNRDQVTVASHVLEFVMDGEAPTASAPTAPPTAQAKPAAPAPASAPPATADEKQKEILRRSLGLEAPAPAAPASTPVPPAAPSAASEADARSAATEGVIKIIAGAVNSQSEVRLKDLVTYIGTSDQAAIKIKGFLAPSLAAAVSKRPEGYFLKAVKAGYPKVNGMAVNEQIFLENGALIEVGGTNMVFYDPEAKKNLAQKTEEHA